MNKEPPAGISYEEQGEAVFLYLPSNQLCMAVS